MTGVKVVCSVAWCTFTWDAFATLAAGGAAVLGAVTVGIRQLRVTETQAKIAGRQTEILEHQVEVERAKLRADLYDRRLAVFKACKAYVQETTGSGLVTLISPDVIREVHEQLEQAEFLFAGSVRDEIRGIATMASDLFNARVDLMALAISANRDDALGTSTTSRRLQARAADLTKSLRDHLPSLATIMGEEMRLYIPRASPSRDSTPD